MCIWTGLVMKTNFRLIMTCPCAGRVSAAPIGRARRENAVARRLAWRGSILKNNGRGENDYNNHTRKKGAGNPAFGGRHNRF
eukprot:2526130-Pyramimonas_sp.AAC.1